jgi:hypothetical protein
MARRPSDRQAPVPLGLVRPRVLLTTEGTYPYTMGGVSSWCDLLVKSLTGFDWQVLPIVAPTGGAGASSCPSTPARSGASRCGPRSCRAAAPAALARRGARRCRASSSRHLSAGRATRRGRGGVDLVPAHPPGVRASSARDAGGRLPRGLREVLAERVPEAGTPPALDLVEAARLYQTLYWVARTAAARRRTPTSCT